jgi:hypothetical protein
MSNYTNRFTVINRQPKGTEVGRSTTRTTVLPVTLRDSAIGLRTLNKDTGVLKEESKVRGIISRKSGTIGNEQVTGATFRWEIEFNGEYQVVKEVVTQKEMTSIFAITNASDDSAINGFQASINDIAEPNSTTNSTSVAISGTQMNNLYTNNSVVATGIAVNNNSLFVGNMQPAPPLDAALTASFVNATLATQIPEPEPSSETDCF